MERNHQLVRYLSRLGLWRRIQARADMLEQNWGEQEGWALIVALLHSMKVVLCTS